MRRRTFSLEIMAAALVLSSGAFAQAPPAAPAGPASAAIGVRSGPGDVEFEYSGFKTVMFEGGFDRRVVTGAPFSAEAVTETIQALADGNRIDQKTSAQMYRDSEGRTRREMKLKQIGPWGPQGGDGPSFISINDPVAAVRYVLNPQEHTARELPAFSAEKARLLEQKKTATAQAGSDKTFFFVNDGQVAVGGMGVQKPASTQQRQASKEDLGQQVIEGVTANGTRETITIPAGAIGNDQPIKIVSEHWYSPELQMDVMTRHDDPRFGETIYKLTNIDQSEPAATLFHVPPDYTVVQDKGPMVIQDGKPVSN